MKKTLILQTALVAAMGLFVADVVSLSYGIDLFHAMPAWISPLLAWAGAAVVLTLSVAGLVVAHYWRDIVGGMARLGTWCVRLKQDFVLMAKAVDEPTVRRHGGRGPLLA